ncbi:alpha/beta hydrolase fold-3 domain-containing protein [Xylariaceae sp. FL0594]|nr:alpha/beta hydrolase fold-3 domain-containing protein [Xylariaceae sp. FL0594]
MASPEPHPLLSRQPLRCLFQVVYIASIIARLPFWLAVSLIPFLRPRPSWTVQQTLMCRALYVLLDMSSRIGFTHPPTRPKNKDEARLEVVEPSSPDFYKGPLAFTHIQPAAIGGTWFRKSPAENKLVMLYFHGGAFVRGDSEDSHSGFAGNTLIHHADIDALFSMQYRLSGYSNLNPFPAALQDALTGYLHLLKELHIPASQIIFAGDSAGGNIAIALLRYVEEFGPGLNIPLPRCVTLFSPWVAPFDYKIKGHPNFASDFLPVSFLRWGALAYGQGLADAAQHPYITHLGNPFRTTVPIFVNYGTAEVFATNIRRWASQMADMHNTLEIHEEKDAYHDTILIGGAVGFGDSARGYRSSPT